MPYKDRSTRIQYCTKWKRDLKREVLGWYGRACRCCQESLLDMLTLDHVNDDGVRDYGKAVTRHRAKSNTATGFHFYGRLLKGGHENRPLDLQVLCWNCQWGKRIGNGFCAHHPDIDLRMIREPML